MPGPLTSTETLAHWHYNPEHWQDFIEYECSVYSKSVRSAIHFMIATVVVAVVLIIPLIAIPLSFGYPFDSNVIGPVFGVCLIAGIFLIVGFIVANLRQQKVAKLKAKPGEAVIRLDELNVNGVDFRWDRGESGWHFVSGERKRVSITPLKTIQILELKF